VATTSGTPDADDVAAYLGPAAPSWDEDTIGAVLAAETAAQARSCRIPGPMPGDLREALLRRCAANLARRQLGPLPGPQGDSETPTIVPARDPEVRRLEGPWRTLVFG
jgi:hypothetical protein